MSLAEIETSAGLPTSRAIADLQKEVARLKQGNLDLYEQIFSYPNFSQNNQASDVVIAATAAEYEVVSSVIDIRRGAALVSWTGRIDNGEDTAADIFQDLRLRIYRNLYLVREMPVGVNSKNVASSRGQVSVPFSVSFLDVVREFSVVRGRVKYRAVVEQMNALPDTDGAAIADSVIIAVEL